MLEIYYKKSLKTWNRDNAVNNRIALFLSKTLISEKMFNLFNDCINIVTWKPWFMIYQIKKTLNYFFKNMKLD